MFRGCHFFLTKLFPFLLNYRINVQPLTVTHGLVSRESRLRQCSCALGGRRWSPLLHTNSSTFPAVDLFIKPHAAGECRHAGFGVWSFVDSQQQPGRFVCLFVFVSPWVILAWKRVGLLSGRDITDILVVSAVSWMLDVWWTAYVCADPIDADLWPHVMFLHGCFQKGKLGMNDNCVYRWINPLSALFYRRCPPTSA